MAKSGVPGFCSICASPNSPGYVKGARDGWNARQFNDYAEQFGERWNRQTWYAHKEHAIKGRDLVITAAEKVRREGALTLAEIKKTSNTELLEAIRDLGMARALASPDEITIDQSIKAVQVLEGRKDKGGDSLAILVQFIVGAPPPIVIEGTAREVTN